MKKKRNFLLPLLMAIVMMAMSPQRMWALSTDTDGYYKIYNFTDLKDFRTVVNGSNSAACAKLMNNITLSGTWTPIGTDKSIYSGTFDGQNHTISGLSMDVTGWQEGFIGFISGATIKNLTVSGQMTSTSSNSNCRESTGGVIGLAKGVNTIENVHSNVNITMKHNNFKGVGGVVGKIEENYGFSTITDCSYSGTLTLNSNIGYVGGIVGNVTQGATITNCNFTGTIKTTEGCDCIGGIVGFFHRGDYTVTISNCTNTGAMTLGKGSEIGGIFGHAGGNLNILNNTFASGATINTLTASTECGYVGGIAGKTDGTILIQECTAAGSIDVGASYDCIAGIVGYCKDNSSLTIKSCLYSGHISNTSTRTDINRVAGIIAYATDNGNNFGGIKGCLSCGSFSTPSSNTIKPGAIASALYNNALDRMTDNYYREGMATAVVFHYSGGHSIPSSNYSRTAAQISSGQVAYELYNGSIDGHTSWRQNIDQGTKDSYPVLDTSHGKVYYRYHKNCAGTTVSSIYTNTDADQIDAHVYVDGVCTQIAGQTHIEVPAQVSGCYQIGNYGNLCWFRDQINSGSNLFMKVQQTADITIPSGVNWTGIGYDKNGGDYNRMFKGTYDGCGYTISGLSCSGNDNALFCYAYNATIKNLGIVNAKITGSTCGVLVYRTEQCTIENCFATGTSNSTSSGLVYKNMSNSTTFTNCYSTVSGVNYGILYTGIIQGSSVSMYYTLTSCYSTVASSKVNQISTADVTSGRLCYLLNGSVSGGITWYQNLGDKGEGFPRPLKNANYTVYQNNNLKCDGKTLSDNVSYFNSSTARKTEDHIYASTYTTDTEPKCTTAGSKSKHCTNYSLCKSTTGSTTIAAKGHGNGTSTKAGYTATYNWTNGTATNPKCLLTLKCNDCSTSLLTNQTLGSGTGTLTNGTKTDATCTTTGSQPCSVSGTYTPSQASSKAYTISNSHSYTIAAIGHGSTGYTPTYTWGGTYDAATCTFSLKCDKCSNDVVTDQSMTTSIDESYHGNPTCTVAGNESWTVAGGSYSKTGDASYTGTKQSKSYVIPALGHDFTSKTLSASTDGNGLYSYVCDRDGSYLTQDVKVIKDYAPNATGNAKHLELSIAGEDYTTTTPITLTDANQFACGSIGITTPEAPTYTRQMTGEWATLALPFKVDVTKLNGCQLYKVAGYKDGTLSLTLCEDNTLDAGTPVFIRRTTDEQTITLTAADKGVDLSTPNKKYQNLYFYGIYETRELNGTGNYILYNNALWNVGAFSGSTVKVAPFRAYLYTESSSGAKMISITFDDDTTRLFEFGAESLELRDGKYLENGKVVIVRNGKKYNTNGQVIK